MIKILFIINPNAGAKRNNRIKRLALYYLPKETYEIKFKKTKFAGHAQVIAHKCKDKFDIIVAAGGDGTIHEIAQALVFSNTALAIIPMGSGNGYARALEIPFLTSQAIKHIAKKNISLVDVISCNDEYFVNVAGIGFDADIGKSFAQNKIRGGLSYFPLVAKHFLKYKPITLEYSCLEQRHTKKVFLASIANTTQYGMNAHIAPLAKFDDGKFDFTMVKPFPLQYFGAMVFRLFNKSIHRSVFVETIQINSLTIHSEHTQIIHLDGEPKVITGNIHFEMHTSALKVIK